MARPKKIKTEAVEGAAKEKKAPAQDDAVAKMLEKLNEFESKMNAMAEENRLLNEKMKLKEESGQNPLTYTEKPVGAPNIIPSFSEKLMRLMEEDDRIVKGKFEFKEITNPKQRAGSSITFHYRKYPGKPIMKYTLCHNHTYEIPKGVADHINGALGGCKYNIHAYVMDKDGNPKLDMAAQEVARTGFHSTTF